MIGVSPDIRFFIFGDSGVLFHPGVNRLWVLNPVAAVVWCLLPECHAEADVQAHLCGRFGIDRAQAERDTAACLEFFAREGLLAGGRPAAAEQENPPGIRLEETRLREPASWADESFLRVPGAAVRFVSGDREQGAKFTRYLRHMDAGECLPRVDAAIALAREPGRDRWSVFLDGRRYVGGAADNEVLPHLYFLVFACAMRGLDRYFLLHGAVLVRNGRALILPGVAGSGKTTLAAILAAEGWQFFSDELIVLDAETGRVLPFPFPMSIKPGSAAVLQSRYPELAQAEVWDRSDGKQVRYLLPPAASLPASLDVQAVPALIVFPRYAADEKTRLEEIAGVEALRRLAATGSSNRALRGEDVAAMIALVEKNPVYTLVYGEAEEAGRVVDTASL